MSLGAERPERRRATNARGVTMWSRALRVALLLSFWCFAESAMAQSCNESCNVCLLRAPFSGRCIQRGNDPLCEARKQYCKVRDRIPIPLPPAPGTGIGASCNEDCSVLCRFSRTGIPEPTCYGQCLVSKAAACGAAATQKDQPLHGNYCGLGNRGGRALDDLDAACKRHDECYDSRVAFACSCDRTISAEAAGVSLKSGIRSSVREKAAIVSLYFLNSYCVPR